MVAIGGLSPGVARRRGWLSRVVAAVAAAVAVVVLPWWAP